MVKMPFAIGGSGSTYIYGHVDAQYREGMSKAEAQVRHPFPRCSCWNLGPPTLASPFVSLLIWHLLLNTYHLVRPVLAQAFVKKAIAHAMARDGSSGGIIRTVTVDATGVEREYIPGDKLPYGP